MTKTADENDTVSVRFTLTANDEILYQNQTKFSFGFGAEIGIPYVLENLIKPMKLFSTKSTTLSLSTLSETNKAFFNLNHFKYEEVRLSVELLSIEKV